MLLEESHAKRMGMVNTNAHAANCAAKTHASFLSIRFIFVLQDSLLMVHDVKLGFIWQTCKFSWKKMGLSCIIQTGVCHGVNQEAIITVGHYFM